MEPLKRLLSRILKVLESEIHDDSSPDTISTWDSFNALMIVSEIERNFNVKFTLQEVMAVKNVLDIKKTLKRHGVTEGID